MTPARLDRFWASSSRRGAENAPSAARESKSSSVTANDAARTRPASAEEAEEAEEAEDEERWLSTVDIKIPPAQNPTVLSSGESQISLTTSIADRIRAAYASMPSPP